jgi:hypothetical protein
MGWLEGISFRDKLTIAINPLTAATSLGVKGFRAFNTTINIKDIL